DGGCGNGFGALEGERRKLDAKRRRPSDLEEPDDGVPRPRILKAESDVRSAGDPQVQAFREPGNDFRRVRFGSVAVQRPADEERGERRSDGSAKRLRQRRHSPRAADPGFGEVRHVSKDRGPRFFGDAKLSFPGRSGSASNGEDRGGRRQRRSPMPGYAGELGEVSSRHGGDERRKMSHRSPG